jgi:hypothetical protein
VLCHPDPGLAILVRAEGPVQNFCRFLGFLNAPGEQTQYFDIVVEHGAGFIAVIAYDLLGPSENIILNGAQNILDLPPVGIILGNEKCRFFAFAHLGSPRAIEGLGQKSSD